MSRQEQQDARAAERARINADKLDAIQQARSDQPSRKPTFRTTTTATGEGGAVESMSRTYGQTEQELANAAQLAKVEASNARLGAGGRPTGPLRVSGPMQMPSSPASALPSSQVIDPGPLGGTGDRPRAVRTPYIPGAFTRHILRRGLAGAARHLVCQLVPIRDRP
jgi:hypothetical protein